jgi:exopolysaccharide biosynthesis polyprenyl glycosylphosphotransferase
MTTPPSPPSARLAHPGGKERTREVPAADAELEASRGAAAEGYPLPRTEPHGVQTTPLHAGTEIHSSAPSSTLTRLRWVRRALALGDVASLSAALAVAHLASAERSPLSATPVLTLILCLPVWVLIFHGFGLYGWKGLSRPSVFEEFRGIVGASATGGILILVISVWWDPPPTATWVTVVIVLTLAFELATRWMIRQKVRRAKREGRLALRTLIVGTNDEARRLQQHLAGPRGWFVPVGTVRTASDLATPDDVITVEDLAQLDETIRRSDAECVFVATTGVSAEQVLQISRACRRTGTELRLTANVTDTVSSRLSVATADGVTAIVFRPVRATPAQDAVKRAVDLTIGSALFALAIPMLAAIALAIRLTSRGPVFFRQERVTKDGRVFTIYKFRTMVQDVERALDGKVIDLSKPFFKLEDDPRLTRVGRFLRAFSLDEIPQLWNVIRGDMSLVGPRPLPAEQVEANADFLRPRHEVRAGLTGLWQVSGRSELDSKDALRMDRFYIENWSLSLDAYILLKTIPTVIARRGAY